MVDNLLFEDRRAQRSGSAGRVAEVVEDFLLLAGELRSCAKSDCCISSSETSILALSPISERTETEANATLCELVILFACGFFRRVFVSEGLAGLGEIGVDLAPDIVELGRHQLFRGCKVVHFVELVEEI